MEKTPFMFSWLSMCDWKSFHSLHFIYEGDIWQETVHMAMTMRGYAFIHLDRTTCSNLMSGLTSCIENECKSVVQHSEILKNTTHFLQRNECLVFFGICFRCIYFCFSDFRSPVAMLHSSRSSFSRQRCFWDSLTPVFMLLNSVQQC